MENYIENEQANFQINTIKMMLDRGLSDLEIASSLNHMNETNLNNPDVGWVANDIRLIISTFKLDKPKHKSFSKLKENEFPRYKLVNNLDFEKAFVQILIWTTLTILTLGIALPFFAYYFTKLIINTTELHEIR